MFAVLVKLITVPIEHLLPCLTWSWDPSVYRPSLLLHCCHDSTFPFKYQCAPVGECFIAIYTNVSFVGPTSSYLDKPSSIKIQFFNSFQGNSKG